MYTNTFEIGLHKSPIQVRREANNMINQSINHLFAWKNKNTFKQAGAPRQNTHLQVSL